MPACLGQRLFQQAYRYNFFQAVSLLEKLYGNIDAKDSPIRFTTDPSIAFPASEISGIKEENGVIRVKSAFLGLYGVSSPLPYYLTTPVSHKGNTGSMLRSFYDIFGHRLYQLFYLAWKKYRQLPDGPGCADKTSRALYALTGLGFGPPETSSNNAQNAFAWRKLMYAGFFNKRACSAASLSRLISLAFKLPKVSITQFAPRWIDNPGKCIAGDPSAQLGKGIFLGEKIKDCTSAFTIYIGPVDRQTAAKLLPTTPLNPGDRVSSESYPASSRYQQMVELINNYLREPFDYAIVVLLDTENTPGPLLKNGAMRLGQGAWLGKQRFKPVEIVIKH